MRGSTRITLVFLLQGAQWAGCLELFATTPTNRREAASSFGGAIFGVLTTTLATTPTFADDDDGLGKSSSRLLFEGRNRNGNKDAVIREDYWYMFGKTPPRLLTTELKGADPQWNAFGSCTQADGGNSCTYVALSQRIPAYTKYGPSIAYGAKEYGKLGEVLQRLATTTTKPQEESSRDALWNEAMRYVYIPQERQMPPGPVDAELKMVLFATAMTTSPNFPQPGKELLVARFYANEVRYANRQILSSIQDRNISNCIEAWKFGQDSWNSYFQVVNRSISPKVGEKFQPVSFKIAV